MGISDGLAQCGGLGLLFDYGGMGNRPAQSSSLGFLFDCVGKSDGPAQRGSSVLLDSVYLWNMFLCLGHGST